MSLVLVCNYIILFSSTFILSSTLAFSTSILDDSLSVEFRDVFSIIYYSFNFFFSFSISSLLYFRKSYSALHFCNFSCNFSLVSYSFLVSFLTPVISDSTYNISSFFYLISSFIACKALSLYCIPKRDFCQSSSKVFFDITIFSISIAASFKVFLAAAVSSFYEISYA